MLADSDPKQNKSDSDHNPFKQIHPGLLAIVHTVTPPLQHNSDNTQTIYHTILSQLKKKRLVYSCRNRSNYVGFDL
jgi:hypothetical protein